MPAGRQMEKVVYLIVHGGARKPISTGANGRRSDVERRHHSARSREVLRIIAQTAADRQASAIPKIVTSLVMPAHQMGIGHSVRPRNEVVTVPSRLVQRFKPAEMITPTGMLLLQEPGGIAVSRQ